MRKIIVNFELSKTKPRTMYYDVLMIVQRN
jgi:hypothetical protein